MTFQKSIICHLRWKNKTIIQSLYSRNDKKQMSKSFGPGRFGNKFFRNFALHFLSHKHNLVSFYEDEEKFKQLGIDFCHGTQRHQRTMLLKNDGFLQFLNCAVVNSNFDLQNDYFQTLEISNLVFHEVQRRQNTIMNHNPFQSRYKSNNDIAVHIRLDDVSQFNFGIDYYKNNINRCMRLAEPDTIIWISTDQENHPLIQELLRHYTNAKIYSNNEIFTIQFLSTCRYIITSLGSFSAMIAYFAFFSNVWFPDRKGAFTRWCAIENFYEKGFHNGFDEL